ncbi:MAG: DUF3575 domain-containing protein [Tannerellaceae bacterium]|nr:DUF3575 domain-containing protein [Tannerellaceae bacterium]
MRKLNPLPAVFRPTPIKRNRLHLFGLLFLFLACGPLKGLAQEKGLIPETPAFAIKTNMLYDATSTFNLGVELKLSQKLTLEVPVNYNPWTFSDNKKIKHVLVQPELRYWFCESFNGTFVGFHGHWSKFNWGGIGSTGYMKEHRFQGWLAGAGVSIGHHWILNNRFSLEASIGVGYAYMDYGQYPCDKCGSKIADKTKHYIGPTKASVSLIYIIK